MCEIYLVEGQQGNSAWRSVSNQLTMNGMVKGSLHFSSERMGRLESRDMSPHGFQLRACLRILGALGRNHLKQSHIRGLISCPGVSFWALRQ